MSALDQVGVTFFGCGHLFIAGKISGKRVAARDEEEQE